MFPSPLLARTSSSLSLSSQARNAKTSVRKQCQYDRTYQLCPLVPPKSIQQKLTWSSSLPCFSDFCLQTSVFRIFFAVYNRSSNSRNLGAFGSLLNILNRRDSTQHPMAHRPNLLQLLATSTSTPCSSCEPPLSTVPMARGLRADCSCHPIPHRHRQLGLCRRTRRWRRDS